MVNNGGGNAPSRNPYSESFIHQLIVIGTNFTNKLLHISVDRIAHWIIKWDYEVTKISNRQILPSIIGYIFASVITFYLPAALFLEKIGIRNWLRFNIRIFQPGLDLFIFTVIIILIPAIIIPIIQYKNIDKKQCMPYLLSFVWEKSVCYTIMGVIFTIPTYLSQETNLMILVWVFFLYNIVIFLRICYLDKTKMKWLLWHLFERVGILLPNIFLLWLI